MAATVSIRAEHKASIHSTSFYPHLASSAFNMYMEAFHIVKFGQARSHLRYGVGYRIRSAIHSFLSPIALAWTLW